MTRTARGFTLVELLVALVIVGMIAAVAVPALRSRGGAAATAKQLAALYEATREAAIARGVSADAVLDLSTGAYYVVREVGPGRPPDTLRRGTLALPASARLATRAGRSGRARMSFDALGRARGDAVVIVDGSSRHEIVADPWTGAPRVEAR